MSDDIASNDNFKNGVLLHCKKLIEEFKSNPFFYKFIFKNNRFLVASNVVTNYYSKEESILSDVKRECLSLKVVSHNTINSLFTLFAVSGRITIKKSEFDNRKLCYKLTPKAMSESKNLLNTMIPSLNLINKGNKIITDYNLPTFYKEYAKISQSGIYLFNLVKNSNVFINKDSGHMIMCLFFLHKYSNIEEKPLKIISLSRKCGISRSNMRSIVLEAEQKRILSYNQVTGEIVATNDFDDMFLEYMAYYLAFVHLGLKFC